jgi:hypothetical protein
LPIIDGDGHWVEFPPVFAEKMRKVGGDKAADGFLAPRGAGEGLKMTPGERTERRIVPSPQHEGCDLAICARNPTSVDEAAATLATGRGLRARRCRAIARGRRGWRRGLFWARV